MGKCIIFCAAGFDALAEPLEKDDFVIAADGGLVHTEKLGIVPNEIIGDFDSLGHIPEGANITLFVQQKTDNGYMGTGQSVEWELQNGSTSQRINLSLESYRNAPGSYRLWARVVYDGHVILEVPHYFIILQQ